MNQDHILKQTRCTYTIQMTNVCWSFLYMMSHLFGLPLIYLFSIPPFCWINIFSKSKCSINQTLNWYWSSWHLRHFSFSESILLWRYHCCYIIHIACIFLTLSENHLKSSRKSDMRSCVLRTDLIKTLTRFSLPMGFYITKLDVL